MPENYVAVTDFPSGISFAMHDLCQRVKFLRIYLVETKRNIHIISTLGQKNACLQIRDSFLP